MKRDQGKDSFTQTQNVAHLLLVVSFWKSLSPPLFICQLKVANLPDFLL